MLGRDFTGENCPHPNPSSEYGRGAHSCQSQRLTPPQPSPSLREREGAKAVVPSHARQGLYQRTAPSLQPPLRAPALALAQGRSNGCEPLVRKQPFSPRMRERGSELSEPTAYPSPALPFAARKGGGNSGSAEPCSAGALPANSALTPTPATRPGPCTGARSFEWLRTFGSQAALLTPHAGEGLKAVGSALTLTSSPPACRRRRSR